MGNDCTMTADGTNFCIPQKEVAKKGNAPASHKYVGKSILHYEQGVYVLSGNLVWIQGPPYPDGKYTNIKNFNTVLVHFLKSGQWIEADEGYPGHTVENQMPWK